MFQYKETMDKLLQKTVAEGEAVGVSALVIHKNKEIYFNAAGFANREKEIPMRRDTICRMFSMTKPITATAVMILAERGEIDLWDPVSKYLPEFSKQKVWTDSGLIPAERDSTIWDLLNMLSGITYPDQSHEPGRRMDKLFRELISRRQQGECVDTREYLKRIAEIPLVFHPGTRWMYGLSADVLGGIIEVVSGRRYGEFLREELFRPLGMKDTGFFVPEEKKCRFAENYIWEKTAGCLVPYKGCQLGEYYGEDVAFESGGAGLVSTLDDYSHFGQMLLQKGEYNGRKILGRKTVEFMEKDRLSPDQKVNLNWESLRGYGYGCLMRVLVDQTALGANASLGEFGWDGWTGNYVIIDPEDEMLLLYFIQRCDAGNTMSVRKLRMATYSYLE